MALAIPKRLKKSLKVFCLVLLINLVLIVLYFGAAFALGLVPINRNFKDSDSGTTIYLVSNAVHVDFVLPVRSKSVDWSELFPYQDFTQVDADHPYLFVGWGERAFYIETPTWDKVRLSTVARAMLWPTPAVLHVEYARRAPRIDEHTRRVVLSESQYKRLARQICESVQTTSDGQLKRISGKGYRDTDNFYEGTGSYHAFNTCNMWTNRLLKETGVTTALWSPFTVGILYHLDN